MPGTLHIVATPIGNLEDITLRALRVLREVAVIAAEDTRRTAKLLTHYGIGTPTISYHEHNARGRLPQLMARLTAGDAVALVTDAGTPAISDPGAELVHACVEASIPVDPVPGVSAPLAAAVASGFPLIPFSIYGFAPARSKDRSIWLATLATVSHTCSFFESPVRVTATLLDAHTILGDRPIVVARELTKAHQEFLRGPAASVVSQIKSTKGEFTVVVGPSISMDSEAVAVSDLQLAHEFGCMANAGGVSRREAISQLARRYNRRTRDVYAAIENAKKSGK
jgi:16S rRNA (cytidine1402-2'-O)-methyltransferase